MMSGLLPPIDRKDVEFWAERRHASGIATFWATSPTSHGIRLVRWDASDAEWRQTSEYVGVDWITVVAADLNITTAAFDNVTTYQAPDANSLLDLLVCTDSRDPQDAGWTFDVDDFELEDEDFRFEEGLIRRYVHVNGLRLSFIESETTPVAVLVEGDDLRGRQLSQLTWNNGGDPASARLIEIRPSVAVGSHRGELSSWIYSFRYDANPHAEAVMLQAWLSHADEFGSGGGAAALALEPLDPSGELTRQAHDAWTREIHYNAEGEGYIFRVTFDSPKAVLEELRCLLAASDDGYLAVRDALARPVEGEWLRRELAEGNTGPLW